MLPYELNITLAQHTPLIHFQHEQPRATLRASEVKPRLDAFLIGKNGLTQCKGKGWLIGDGDQEALDYKMRIINGPEKPGVKLGVKEKKDKDGNPKFVTEPEMYPLMLANMGGKETKGELKNFKMYTTVKVEIFSYYKDLIEEIKKQITLFWATNNFGNRQSKGFGSFYPQSSDPLYITPVQVLQNNFDKLLCWDLPADVHYTDIFKDIDIINRLMKSGFNFPDHPMITEPNGKKHPDFSEKGEFATYQSGFLKDYFLSKFKIGSEKREIKESLFKPQVRISKDKTLKENNYVRAVLGTAGFFEYRDYDRRGIVNVKSDDVERFKSPLTYKVFSDKVFILPGNWKEISGKKFVFSTERDKTKPIPAPTVNFELGDFLFDFARYFNGFKDDEVGRLDDIINESRRKAPELIKQYLNCLDNVNLIPLMKKSDQ